MAKARSRARADEVLELPKRVHKGVRVLGLREIGFRFVGFRVQCFGFEV